ncbi:MAG: ferritin-like domain-containing protein [Rugosibacter sp.]
MSGLNIDLSSSAPQRHWVIDQIAFDQIAHDRIANEDTWFYVLAAASFVESLADLYTKSLLTHMAGDAEVSQWLREQWEPEEMQHGRALRRYVEEVWPEFDWQKAYEEFCIDYRPYCKPELLEPTRALEMVARCVVETGTSGLYGLLMEISPEPVLKTLTGHIRNDEVRHYKYFYHYFLRYRELERPSRWQVARVLRRRLGAIGQEDAYLAVKNAFVVRHPGKAFGPEDFQQLQRVAGALARSRYPCEMTVKMLLKPLHLPGFINRVAQPLLVRHARRVVAPA